jgi:hypothetical protein
MGDSGEGLIDQEARIQERMDDLARSRAQQNAKVARDPEQVRAAESLRLARTELERQFETTTHEGRRTQIQQAIAELDRRIAEVNSRH